MTAMTEHDSTMEKAASPTAPAEAAEPVRGSRTRRPTWSIRWIVTSAVVALITLIVLSIAAITERNVRKTLTTEIEARLLLQARNLAQASSGALLTNFPELTLNPLVKEMLASQPELAFAVVVDPAGVIRGHSDAWLLGTAFVLPPNLEAVPGTVVRGPGEALKGNAQILMASVAVPAAQHQTLGTVLVGLRRGHIDRMVDRARRQHLLALGVFLVVGIASAFVLTSMLLRPVAVLREGIERIGRGDLDTPLKLRDRTELGVLAEAVNEMAAELKSAQAKMVERERLAHEMDLAHRIQRSLLPSSSTVAGSFVIQGAQRAAAEVGGDYYDVFALPHGKIGLAVADVSGKGMAGCLVTSMIFALLRAFRTAHSSPASLLAALDERFGEILQRGTFITMFYAILDPSTGRLVYASAGHSPLMVYRQRTREVEWLRARGIPLAATRGAIRAPREDSEIVIEPGDVVVQFTDGVNEAFDPTGVEQFGFQRMEPIVVESAPRGCVAVLESLQRAVEDWRKSPSPMDDETLLIVRREFPSAVESKDAAGGGPAGSAERALSWLAEAEQQGHRLRLPASTRALGRLRDWLHGCPLLKELGTVEMELLHLALHEVCANIVEHGYGEDATKKLEIWWMPDSDQASGIGTGDPSAMAADRIRLGRFLVRDEGAPFHAPEWTTADFNDPAVRKRGRGFGLHIICQIMEQVEYHPSTHRGNITLMTFGPTRAAGRRKEMSHA